MQRDLLNIFTGLEMESFKTGLLLAGESEGPAAVWPPEAANCRTQNIKDVAAVCI